MAARVVARPPVTRRAGRARADAKPAYVFFNDETLEAIAKAMPSSLAALSRIKGIGPALSRIKGIGPAKLEAYGDDILALLESVRDG
ncbi:MAG: HRDC domain-containing protein [Actinobacteria bacterium]|nr:HRDC domain-containing protein [Actinomycetota bacterium]